MNAAFTRGLFLRMAHTSLDPSGLKMIHRQVSVTLPAAQHEDPDQGAKSQYDRERRLIDQSSAVA
jgi:hypothetical protein